MSKINDKTNEIDPGVEPYGEVVAAEKDRQVMASKEWLASDFGKMWIKDYNINF